MKLTVESVETVDLDTIKTHPANPRQGKVAEIKTSLDTNGQYRPIVVQRSTGYILAGNHTYLAARDLGWSDIQVAWVDVDDEQAYRIMAADNRTADLGEYDSRLLAELLAELPDLAGTGYDEADLDRLMASLDDAAGDTPTATSSAAGGDSGDGPAPGAADLLEPPEEDVYKQQWGVIVICDTEAEQENTYRELNKLGYDCKVVTV